MDFVTYALNKPREIDLNSGKYKFVSDSFTGLLGEAISILIMEAGTVMFSGQDFTALLADCNTDKPCYVSFGMNMQGMAVSVEKMPVAKAEVNGVLTQVAFNGMMSSGNTAYSFNIVVMSNTLMVSSTSITPTEVST